MSFWHSFKTLPENFNTNVPSRLLQTQAKNFSLNGHNRSVHFIFQRAPNWLDGAESLRGASPSLLMFVQIPAVTDSSGNTDQRLCRRPNEPKQLNPGV